MTDEEINKNIESLEESLGLTPKQKGRYWERAKEVESTYLKILRKKERKVQRAQRKMQKQMRKAQMRKAGNLEMIQTAFREYDGTMNFLDENLLGAITWNTDSTLNISATEDEDGQWYMSVIADTVKGSLELPDNEKVTVQVKWKDILEYDDRGVVDVTFKGAGFGRSVEVSANDIAACLAGQYWQKLAEKSENESPLTKFEQFYIDIGANIDWLLIPTQDQLKKEEAEGYYK